MAGCKQDGTRSKSTVGKPWSARKAHRQEWDVIKRDEVFFNLTQIRAVCAWFCPWHPTTEPFEKHSPRRKLTRIVA